LLTGSGKNYNGVALRIIATCLILAAASGVLAPSSQELHNRYGELYLESFLARPGIGLTVEYGSDHSTRIDRTSPPPLPSWRKPSSDVAGYGHRNSGRGCAGLSPTPEREVRATIAYTRDVCRKSK